MDHPSPQDGHRMSYESFTFVGVENAITYLQCDVLICDNQADDQRCIQRQCLEENVRRRRRSHRSFVEDSEHRVASGPMIVMRSRSVMRMRRDINMDSGTEVKKYDNRLDIAG